MEEKNGKQVPKRVGLGNEGDKQSDYEYTVALMIEQGSHIASVGDGGKDNTGLFEGKYEVLTEKHGEILYDWANSSDIPASEIKIPVDTGSTFDELADMKKQITAKIEELGGSSNKAIVGYFKKNGNYNTFDNIKQLKDYYNDICNLKEENN